jgi:hypothetical protein
MSGPLTEDIKPVNGRCQARQRQTLRNLFVFGLSGALTADIRPVDGRRRAR